MRMWGVNPKYLCRKHLLGEHVEMHMFIGHILKNKSIKGFIDKKLIDVTKIKDRHDELVLEMKQRGWFCHITPLKYNISDLSFKETGNIDIDKNLKELSQRCPECRKRIENDYRVVYRGVNNIILFKRRFCDSRSRKNFTKY